MNNNFKQCSFN